MQVRCIGKNLHNEMRMYAVMRMYPIMMIIVGEWSVTNGIMGVNGTLYNVRDKHNIVNDSSPQ